MEVRCWSSSAPNTDSSVIDTSIISDPLERFTLWALETLNLRAKPEGDGVYRMEIPEDRPAFEDSRDVRFTCLANGTNGAVQPVRAGSPLFQWLVQQLQDRPLPINAAPDEQPAGVAALSPHLFSAYEVDGGKVQLAGCTLEDRPLLRLTYATGEEDSNGHLVHVFSDRQGNVISDDLLADLGVDRIKPLDSVPRTAEIGPLDQWIEQAETAGCERVQSADPFICATLVWCKHCAGKLLFDFDGASIEIPFSGWASRFAQGKEKPPPYTCPLTGAESYHLAATDDGRITVASEIDVCCESGRRVLSSELVTCEDSGQRALDDYFTRCPVSERHVLRSGLQSCSVCQQDVSASALKAGRCAACRTPQPAGKDEPRMARVLGEFPKLDRWRKWKLSETAAVYVLVGSTMLRRLIVVVDKDTLEPRHLLTGNRWLPNLTPVPKSQWDDFLGHA